MKRLRRILYPFSLLYGGITMLRNKLYDKNILVSREFGLPVIAVGNLSTGGTGKTPMTEYLIRILEEQYRLATLSRGYKRTTKGFLLLEGSEAASRAGDEPLQFKNKFPEVSVAVDEHRTHGIEQLLQLQPPPEVILLDDAFQHRKVKAGFYILLTAYQQLYTEDLILPAGDLRESRSGAERADMIVVTKCPSQISAEEKQRIAQKLKLHSRQELFFSSISYAPEVQNEKEQIPLQDFQNFTLVTGIAKPEPLVDFLHQAGLEFDHKAFPDHHNFTVSELEALRKFDRILTTEKDYMRLRKELSSEQLFYLPIWMQLLGKKDVFEEKLKSYIESL